MSEKICLKWNDFQTNVSKTFGNLRNEEDFFDVTLVSDDQKQMSAHKVILSACSEYFKNILKQNKHSNPLLCLEGVSFNELTNILDYIYYGKVTIHENYLDRFLTIANRLKLDGLTSSDTTFTEFIEEAKYTRMIDNDINTKLLEMETKDTVKPVNNCDSLSNVDKTKIVIDSDEFQNIGIKELDDKLFEHLERYVGRKWKCTMCEKILRDKCDARIHVESHFEGLQFPCQHCDSIFKSRGTLKVHCSRIHK